MRRNSHCRMGIFRSKEDAAELEGDVAPREWQSAPRTEEDSKAADTCKEGLMHGVKAVAAQSEPAKQSQLAEQLEPSEKSKLKRVVV